MLRVRVCRLLPRTAPLLLPFLLCLFLTVGVPVLVIAHAPTVNADSWASDTSGDSTIADLPDDPVTATLGGHDGTPREESTRDQGSTSRSGTHPEPVPAAADPKASAEQLLRDTAEPAVPPAAGAPESPESPAASLLPGAQPGDGGPGPHSPGAIPPTTPNWQQLAVDLGKPSPQPQAQHNPQPVPGTGEGSPAPPAATDRVGQVEQPLLLDPNDPTASGLVQVAQAAPQAQLAHTIPAGPHPADPTAPDGLTPPGTQPGTVSTPAYLAVTATPGDRPGQPTVTQLVLHAADGGVLGSATLGGHVLTFEDGSWLGIDPDGTLRNPDGTALGTPAGTPEGDPLQPAAGEVMTAGVPPDAALLGQAAAWVQDNWEYLVAEGVLIAGLVAMSPIGVAYLGAAGAAMISGGLVAAGMDAGFQKLTKDQVAWGKAAGSGVIGSGTAALGLIATVSPVLGIIHRRSAGDPLGTFAGAYKVPIGSSNLSPFLTGAATASIPGVAGGMGNRWIHGENWLDPYGILVDLTTNALIGGVAGKIGERFPETIDVTVAAPGHPPLAPGHGSGSTSYDGTEMLLSRSRLISHREDLQHNRGRGWANVVDIRTMREPIRHQTMHALINRTLYSDLAQRLGLSSPDPTEITRVVEWLDQHSHLWKYLQEAAAETYGAFGTRSLSRSLSQGLTSPFQAGYQLQPATAAERALGAGAPLSRWRVGVEAAGVGVPAAAAAGYGLSRVLHSPRPDPAGGDTGRR